MEKVSVKLKKDLSLLLESLLSIQATLSNNSGSTEDRDHISSVIYDWHMENHPDIGSSVLDAINTFRTSTEVYEDNRKNVYRRLVRKSE